MKYNTVKGAFYFDLYWPELEQSCKTEKKSKDDALAGKKVGTEERRPSPEKQTLEENGEKTDISSSVQKTENPQTRIPSVQNETQAEYTFIDTQTSDGIPYTILRFLQSDNFYAFFYKDGYYWMVFPSKEQRKIPAYFSMDGAIQEIIQLPHKEAFIVRLAVNPAYSFVKSAPNGDVYFAQEDFFVEKGRDMSPFILSSEKGVELEIDEHTAPIRFLDPIVGNEIIALPSSKDFLKDKYSYDFMETLPSERGIVFISKTEYFEAVPSENGFMFIP